MGSNLITAAIRQSERRKQISRERDVRMSNLTYRVDKSNVPNASFSGASFLAFLPVFVIFYILLVLPFFPDDGKGRVENILFWPVATVPVLTLLVLHWTRIDPRFFRSVPIMSITAYLALGTASVAWAYSPEFALSRILVEVLAFIVVAVPFALPIRTKSTIPMIHLCYAIALAVNAVYVLTTPTTPIGHPGYFSHKQGLGLLCAVGIILSSYELFQPGWRRVVAIIALGLGIWLIFASESKSALALSVVAVTFSGPILLLGKKTRLTPAFVVAAVTIASIFVPYPAERLGYKLYGDSTLTGRTGIWNFIEGQASQKPWLGWGFHSYFFVPNSPQNLAAGYIREMPSSHSGYMETKLELGRIGYWIFLIFIYSSLHVLERVRRKDPWRAWLFLSFELFAVMVNLLDSNWLSITHFWLLNLIVVAESVRLSWPGEPSSRSTGQERAVGFGPARASLRAPH